MKKEICIILVMIISSSCTGKGKETMEKKGDIVAKVGTTAISQADYDREFQSLPDYARQMFSDEKGKEKFLDEVINKEILYQEAVKQGLDKTPEFGRKLEDFRKLSLVSAIFEKEVLTKAKVSDQEVKDYFEKHKEDFAVTSQIRASHILVKNEQEAKDVLASLKKGEPFDALAQKVSTDKGSAKKGGDLGYFSKGDMVPEFEKAAAKLKVGEISEPVKTEFGYHIIKVTDRKKGPVLEFEKVKDMLSQQLGREKQKEAFDAYLASLKKTYSVEINKEALGRAMPGTPQESPAQGRSSGTVPPKTEAGREAGTK